jgi:hypothetical protein
MEQNYSILSVDEIIEIIAEGSEPIEPRSAIAPILSDEEKMFAQAIDRYQRDHRRAMLTWRDIFEIVQSLGYRKAEQLSPPSQTNGSPQNPAHREGTAPEKPT